MKRGLKGLIALPPEPRIILQASSYKNLDFEIK
jgi:hypothetical protein